MEYNIDILVAGCNTTCLHCYVDGGHAPAMSMSDFYLCMEKLQPVFEQLKDKVSFTLDNELFNHPDAAEILECVAENYKESYYHHGSTTGIALLDHPKQDRIFDVLTDNNWDFFSFAVHGNHEAHNAIVNNDRGLKSLIAASKLCKEHNCKVWISLMISKKLVRDLEGLDDVLCQIPYDSILPVIPDYYPTPRLMKYQSIRCNSVEYDELLDFLAARNVDVSDIENAMQSYNEETIIETLDPDSVAKELTSKSTAFFHIDNKLDFYLGNTGSPLKHFGNIRDLSSEEIYRLITSAEDNYYETGSIHYDDIASAVSKGMLMRSDENYVYPSKISGIIAMIQNVRLR